MIGRNFNCISPRSVVGVAVVSVTALVALIVGGRMGALLCLLGLALGLVLGFIVALGDEEDEEDEEPTPEPTLGTDWPPQFEALRGEKRAVAGTLIALMRGARPDQIRNPEDVVRFVPEVTGGRPLAD